MTLGALLWNPWIYGFQKRIYGQYPSGESTQFVSISAIFDLLLIADQSYLYRRRSNVYTRACSDAYCFLSLLNIGFIINVVLLARRCEALHRMGPPLIWSPGGQPIRSSQKMDTRSFDLQVANHKLLGHGSGKLLKENADGTKNFDPSVSADFLHMRPDSKLIWSL